MRYRIRITGAARRELVRLPGHVRQRARHLAEALTENPTPPGAKELRGMPGRYRIALLAWRIIYRVERDSETVVALTDNIPRATVTQTTLALGFWSALSIVVFCLLGGFGYALDIIAVVFLTLNFGRACS